MSEREAVESSERSTNDPPVDGIGALLVAHGELRRGRGLASGVFALSLSALAMLAVLAFHFPAYLTTPDLRQKYDVEVLRRVLAGALLVAGGISLSNLLLGRARWLATWAFGLVLVALLLGGPTVPVGDFPDHTPYLGLDFLILDLLASTLVFVFIEKLFGLRKAQPIFRPEWQNDLVHFAFNHLLVGVALLALNQALFTLGATSPHPALGAFWATWSLWLQVPVVILVADLAQYWIHRAYHEIPWLWRVHAVHHSVKHMDWLAGSRLHVVELLSTRIGIMAPLYLLGFSREAIDVYILVVGVQAVFNHANVSLHWGPLSYLIVTPNFHHWHHSREDVAIDKNYAAHYAFLDHLFGTAVQAENTWPEAYGVVGDYVPPSFVRQLAFPFLGAKIRVEPHTGSDPGAQR